MSSGGARGREHAAAEQSSEAQATPEPDQTHALPGTRHALRTVLQQKETEAQPGSRHADEPPAVGATAEQGATEQEPDVRQQRAAASPGMPAATSLGSTPRKAVPYVLDASIGEWFFTAPASVVQRAIGIDGLPRLLLPPVLRDRAATWYDEPELNGTEPSLPEDDAATPEDDPVDRGRAARLARTIRPAPRAQRPPNSQGQD